MGEGRFFLSLKPYQEGFLQALGFAPFAGTLNVRVEPKDVEKIRNFKEKAPIDVPGFEIGGRKYFEIKLMRARLGEEWGALVFPYFNHHPPDVLEFVAEKNLRERLRLRDGDKVQLEIEE